MGIKSNSNTIICPYEYGDSVLSKHYQSTQYQQSNLMDGANNFFGSLISLPYMNQPSKAG